MGLKIQSQFLNSILSLSFRREILIMKMRDFFGAFDCFFSTINDVKVFVQRTDEMGFPYHYTHRLYEWEITDAVCHLDNWYWADYTINGISVIDNVLHIICTEW